MANNYAGLFIYLLCV